MPPMPPIPGGMPPAPVRGGGLRGGDHIVNAEDHDRGFCGGRDRLGLDTERLDNAGCLHVGCLAFVDVKPEGLLAFLVRCTDLDEHVDGVEPCVLCKGARDDLEG